PGSGRAAGVLHGGRPAAVPVRRARQHPQRPRAGRRGVDGARRPGAHLMSTTATLSERVATRVSSLLAGRGHDRRRFLSRAALVGTALAVNPFGFLLRPQSAYASVCGPANECSQGWTAFCCTINGGANTCPPGSYVAGWWKITSSSFCRGGARYIVDCNRLPEAHCSCRCAD